MRGSGSGGAGAASSTRMSRERERVVTQGIDSEDLSPSQQVPGSHDTDWLLLFRPASMIDLCRLRAGHVMLLNLPLNTRGPAANLVVPR